jgi:hypothetical protein
MPLYILIYWRVYGGWRAIFRSPYFIIAAATTALCWQFWGIESVGTGFKWPAIAQSTIPSILGYSFAAMAILLTLNSGTLLREISQSTNDETSLLMDLMASFFHFILVKVLALILSIITVATPNVATSMLGFAMFCYGILSIIPIAGTLLQMSLILNGKDDDEWS